MTSFIVICAESLCLYLPLIIGGFILFSLMKIPNISLETSFVTGAAVATYALSAAAGLPSGIILFVALCAALLGGALVGAITSFLVIVGRLPHLLASILTMGIGYGLNLCLLGGSYVSLAGTQNCLSLLPFAMHPELGVLALLALVLIGALGFLLKTALGYSFAVQGNNPQFFQNYGINASYVVGMGLTIGNALAGVAGFCVAQTLGFVDIYAGSSMSLLCITVLIIGKALVGRYAKIKAMLPVVGLTVYVVLQQILVKFGFGVKYFSVIQALIVIAVVLVYYRRRSTSELAGDHLGV